MRWVLISLERIFTPKPGSSHVKKGLVPENYKMQQFYNFKPYIK